MEADPFRDSEALSAWASGVLTRAGIHEVSHWRMLEYWMQVELYRAAETGNAGAWKYLGEYEQPYYTTIPRSGCKSNTKWVDMVLAEPLLQSPRRIAWIELKDVGRSKLTLAANLKGVGHDLAALYTLLPQKTKEIWLNPLPHAIDRGRLDEWSRYATWLDTAEHFIAQIVIVPLGLTSGYAEEFIAATWIRSFEERVKIPPKMHGIRIAGFDGGGFRTFALVAPLPNGTANRVAGGV